MVLLRTTWQHIRRSPYQAVAAILIMGLTIFASTIFTLAALTSSEVIHYFESRPQITAFFKSGTDQSQVQAFEDKLKATGKVAKTKYVSQEEALAIYKEQNKNDPLLLELVTADILPASLEVSATDVRYLSQLDDLIKQEPIVEEVVFQKNIVDTLISWTSFVRKAGVTLIGFLTFESVLIVIMVIAMKIAIKREEIEIMRLLGATAWFVRLPFLMEGIIYGVVGSLLAVLVSFGLFWSLKTFISSFFSGIPLTVFNMPNILAILLFEILGGAVVGMVGSFLAVWRYLKA